jgi:organic radical activating enzyme
MSEVLRVFGIWKTIQGEGPYAGTPAVFIRLAGCNLSCPWCDTDHNSQVETKSVQQILEEVELVAGAARLVVVTGGEPFLQKGAGELLGALSCSYSVQVETNGTLPPPRNMPRNVMVVCSPKPGHMIHEGWKYNFDAWKYVVRDGEVDERGLPFDTSRPPPAVSCIYIQPMDEHDEEKNKRNVELAVRICLTFGYKLSLQQHKIIGVE